MSILLQISFKKERDLIDKMDIPAGQREALLLYTLQLESQIALIRQLNQIEAVLLKHAGLIATPANPFEKGEVF